MFNYFSNKKKFLSFLLILPILFTFISTGSSVVYAQSAGNPGNGSAGNPPPSPLKLDNPFKGGDSLYALLRSVINDILLPIGGVLCVLAFIYAGFQYVIARGDPKKITDAHNALLYAAVGTALVLGAWVFAKVICSTIAAISENPNICPPL